MTDPLGVREALEARDNLAYIVDNWPTLMARLHGGGGNALTGMPRHRETRLPINVYVSDLMREIEDEARILAFVLMDEVHGYSPYTSEMPGLLRDVALHHGHWTAGDDIRAALDFTDWAHEYARKVRGVVEMPEPSRFIGECSTDECEGELYLRENATAAVCPACGQLTTIGEQMEFVRGKFEDMLLTQADLVDLLSLLGIPVKQPTLSKWVARGRLVPRVEREHYGDLYAAKEACELAEDMHDRKRRAA